MHGGRGTARAARHGDDDGSRHGERDSCGRRAADVALGRGIREEGRNVTWVCDPMHGNTITAGNGYKTRAFDSILSEVRKFMAIHKSLGTVAGGVHFELTGKDVVECIGGDQSISEGQLAEGLYETLCDPRLNASQALELAFQLYK